MRWIIFLSFSDKEVQTMWRSLKDRAKKLYKKWKKPTGSGANSDDDGEGEEKREKWRYWWDMQFIFEQSGFGR